MCLFVAVLLVPNFHKSSTFREKSPKPKKNVPEPQRPLLPPGTTCRYPSSAPRPPRRGYCPETPQAPGGTRSCASPVTTRRAGVQHVPLPCLGCCGTEWVCVVSWTLSRCHVCFSHVRACRATVPSRTRGTDRQALSHGLLLPVQCSCHAVLDATPGPVTLS